MLNRLRPWIAAVLALVFVGLGHAYLRRWGRALLWVVVVVLTSVLLHAFHDVEPANPITEPDAVPVEILVPLTLFIAMSALDAFLIGRADLRAANDERANRGARVRSDSNSESADRGRGDGSDPLVGDVTGALSEEVVSTGGRPRESPTVTCPHCGKETDAELDFCHWCTESLPASDERS